MVRAAAGTGIRLEPLPLAELLDFLIEEGKRLLEGGVADGGGGDGELLEDALARQLAVAEPLAAPALLGGQVFAQVGGAGAADLLRFNGLALPSSGHAGKH